MANRAERSRVALFQKIDMKGGDKDQCWPFTGATGGTDGRPYARLNGKMILVYKEIYEMFHGVTLPKGTQMLHSCDNPTCCNPHHVYPGTHRENMEDMSKKGRGRNGTQLGRLPIEAVRTIRKRLNQGFPHKHIVLDIKDQYGLTISPSVVAHINNGISYRGVGLVEDEEVKDG